MQGYVYKLEPGVGLGYHPDGVVTARLKRKQDAIVKNRQTAQKKVESAKEKVEQLVLPKEGESEWDLKGKELCDDDVTKVMDSADTAV